MPNLFNLLINLFNPFSATGLGTRPFFSTIEIMSLACNEALFSFISNWNQLPPPQRVHKTLWNVIVMYLKMAAVPSEGIRMLAPIVLQLSDMNQVLFG